SRAHPGRAGKFSATLGFGCRLCIGKMNLPSFYFRVALPIADIIARHWDPPLLLIAKLAAVLALVLLNGFFVTAEFALVKIRGSQIDTLAAEGSKRAMFAKQVKDNLNAYLSACQVGITAASLGLGWAGG